MQNKDCMKNSCEFLRKITKMINFKKEKYEIINKRPAEII